MRPHFALISHLFYRKCAAIISHFHIPPSAVDERQMQQEKLGADLGRAHDCVQLCT